MKHTFLLLLTIILLSSCVSTNEPTLSSSNTFQEYTSKARSLKTDPIVKIILADKKQIFMIAKKFWILTPLEEHNIAFKNTAIKYCNSLKKNTYLNYKAPVGKISIFANPALGIQLYEVGYYRYANEVYQAIRYVCANNKKEALLGAGVSFPTYPSGNPHQLHKGKWDSIEYKRELSVIEIAENKEQALEDKRKAAALKQKQRDNLITKLENIYSKDCTGGLLSKKFEKGTKEYENCLLEKDKIAKAKVETEKKAIAKRQIEIDEKLAAMTPKERHAYNCATAFKFRKGTEKYNDCVFKLYTAELDMQKLELEKQVAEAQIQAAANQQARAEAVANAQIAAAKAAKRAASLNSSIQLMQMGSSMLGSSAPKSNSSFGIDNRVRTTCRNVGGFINCN